MICFCKRSNSSSSSECLLIKVRRVNMLSVMKLYAVSNNNGTEDFFRMIDV